MTAQIRSRVSTIILHEDCVLAFHAEDPFDQTPYIFLPGGQIERGETLTAAAERETLEETGYEISLDTLWKSFARYDFQWNNQLVACETWFFKGWLKDPKQPPHPVDDANYHRGVTWVSRSELNSAFSYHPAILQAIEAALRETR